MNRPKGAPEPDKCGVCDGACAWTSVKACGSPGGLWLRSCLGCGDTRSWVEGQTLPGVMANPAAFIADKKDGP